MKKFNLKLRWKAECSGRVEVVAETLEDAIKKVNENKEYYLVAGRNGYMGFKETAEIKDIIEDTKLTEECIIKDVTYVSVWDNGSEMIETKAKLNVTTGEIMDIESYSGDELECLTTLDAEYVRLDDENKYVFTVKDSGKKVTQEYILNTFEEGRLAYGECLYIVYNEAENQVSLIYGDGCTSFVYEDGIYEVMAGAPMNELSKFLKEAGCDIEEE